jgi:hypothetical protein
MSFPIDQSITVSRRDGLQLIGVNVIVTELAYDFSSYLLDSPIFGGLRLLSRGAFYWLDKEHGMLLQSVSPDTPDEQRQRGR